MTNRAPAPRPPIQRPISRKYQRGPSNEALVLVLGVLSAIMVALIIILAVIKSGCNTSDNGSAFDSSSPAPESTPSVEVDNDPSDPPKLWQPEISDPTAFVPVSDSSTVDLKSNQIYSNNVIMVDLSSGKVVCQYAADTKIYPASMTKIMTVAVACDLIEDMNDTFVFTKELLYTIEAGATNAYFLPGNPVPMIDLIYGAIIPSGADACIGLAHALAGSEEAFVKLMNEKAAELGCTGTNFTNPIGLHNENHYSTVRDIATIMSYALENPFLRKVLTSTSYKTVAPVDRADGTLYSSWNSSALKSDKATMIGTKSGYTPEAGRCLSSVSKTPDGREYVIVSAGAFFREDISGTDQTFADVKYLCDNYIK